MDPARLQATAIGFAALLLASTPSFADETSAPPWARTFLPRGTRVASLEGGYIHSFNGSEARLETGAVGVGYCFLDNVSINVELAGFAVQQPGPDAGIYEGDLLLRHHLLNWDRFSIYFDVAGGISYATEPVPESGTYFNYTLRTGVGAAFELGDHLYLIGGARYFHLSNGRLEGPEHNASINATEAYVGLMFTF